MPIRLLGTIILAMLLATTRSAEGKTRKIPPQLLQEMVASQIACHEADKQMHGLMLQANKIFAQRCLAQGSLPRSKKEARTACADLQPLADQNPYGKQPLLVKNALTQLQDTTSRAFVGVDPSISTNTVKFWRQFPPPEWSAAPGSIAVIHNGRDRFIIWAAGLDGKPLKDDSGAPTVLDSTITFR